MRLLLTMAATVALVGCDKEIEGQTYIDPISGAEAQFYKRQLDGWQIYQPDENPAGAIVVAKEDSPVVIVMDFSDSRWISTGSDGDVIMKDTDYDGSVDFIEFSESDPIVIHQATLVDGKWVYRTIRNGASDNGPD